MLPQLLDPLPDPRRETQNKLHNLHDISMMVLCAVLIGVEDGVGMETFTEEKAAWLRGFWGLPNGIPSHDTLSDVMGRIDPGALPHRCRFFGGLARAAKSGIRLKGGGIAQGSGWPWPIGKGCWVNKAARRRFQPWRKTLIKRG